MTERTCRECGTTFTSKYRQATCSLVCRRTRNERRTKALFSPSERLAIFERDGWTCGICHRPVDPEVPWPHPMSAAVDHIVPVSEGGAHAPHNAQCAHWICNSRKGPAGGPTSHVMSSPGGGAA